MEKLVELFEKLFLAESTEELDKIFGKTEDDDDGHKSED